MTDRKLDRFGDDDKPQRQGSSVAADDAFYYKRYPHKARAGFRGLSMEQKGFYAELIELVMEARGPLSDNDVDNARTFGCDIRLFRRLKAELLELERIKVEEGTLFDERAIRELVRSGLYSESQARRAKTRWKKKHAPPRVVALSEHRDLGPTVAATVGATVAATVERNVHRTHNEINGPIDAEENRREELDSNPNDRAPPVASPPLQGGDGLSKNARRVEALAALKQLHAKPPAEGASNEPSDGESEPKPAGDRKAVRS